MIDFAILDAQLSRLGFAVYETDDIEFSDKCKADFAELQAHYTHHCLDVDCDGDIIITEESDYE